MVWKTSAKFATIKLLQFQNSEVLFAWGTFGTNTKRHCIQDGEGEAIVRSESHLRRTGRN